MSGRRGFTLLEMLVATTIMAIAIVGLLGGIAGATRSAAHLRDYDRAVQLARWRMNDLLADMNVRSGQSLGSNFDKALTGGTEMGWQARVSTVLSPTQRVVGQPSLERIELRVWWMVGDQRRTLDLDAHRTRNLRAGDL